MRTVLEIPVAQYATEKPRFSIIASKHARYYNKDRPPVSLDGDAPAERSVEPIYAGRVVATPRVGGLLHRYARAA